MNKKIIFISTLLFVGNSVASAQDTPWYAGARIGATHYSNFDNTQSSGNLKGDVNFSGGLFLGYNINDWFALETGYTHLGKIEVTNDTEIKNQAFDLVGKFTWQATKSLDLFAKAGVALYQTEGKHALSGFEDNGLNATAGLGLEHHFTDNLSARLEYQLYHSLALDDQNYESEWDTHLIALGVVYSWGGQEAAEIKDAPIFIQKEKIVEGVTPAIVALEKVIKVGKKTAKIDFATAKEKLSATSIGQLQPIIQHLSDYPQATIVVIGHTDSRGASQFNQELSEHRAEAVAKYLTKEYSIATERINTLGAGEFEPIASNETAQGRAKNRQVSVFSPSLTVTVQE